MRGDKEGGQGLEEAMQEDMEEDLVLGRIGKFGKYQFRVSGSYS